MKVTWCRKVLPAAGLLLTVAVMAACGGGGGSTSSGGAAKATIAGAVTFPSMGSLVAKRVAAVTTVTDVTVEVYGLDGKKAADPVTVTTYDSVQNTYSYSLPPLPTGVDYVVKVKKGLQVLKKLVEKKEVVVGAAKQNVDAATTATVVIAAQRLSTPTVKVVLGDAPPTGTTVTAEQLTSLSQGITDMKPAVIELNITTAVAGGRTSLTSDTVNYANVYNMVVAAVSTPTVGSVDSLLAGSVVNAIPTFDAAAPTVKVFTNMSGANAGSVVTETVTGYVPPTTNAGTASAYVAAATAYLNQQDIANANLNFELALIADSNNVPANIGGAITSGMLLLDDEQVKAILLKWEVVLPTVTQMVQATSPIENLFGSVSAKVTVPTLAKTVASAPVASVETNKILAAFSALKAKMPQQKTGFRSLAKELGMAPTTAPNVSEMQTVIENVIIPGLDKILARLAKVEGVSGNSFTITAAMQGNPTYGEDVVLRDGEYYGLDAAVNVFQTLFKIATAYNLDVPTGYTYDTISRDPLAMINNQAFLTLRTGGAVRMATALANAQAAVAKALATYNVLKDRTSLDGLNITDWTTDDKASFVADLAKITAALSAETTITVGEKSITVNFTRFFSNPLTRANLPTLGYDVTRNSTLSATHNKPVAGESSVYDSNGNTVTVLVPCDIVPKSDLPDYSLNGILPGNTSTNNVAEFNGILPAISGALLTGPQNLDARDFTTDGTYIYYATNGTHAIKRITTSGVVSVVATSSGTGGYIRRLLCYNGGFYSINTLYSPSGNVITLAPITITGTTYTVGIPEWSSTTFGSWTYLSAATSNGTDIYYAVDAYNPIDGSSTSEVRKVNNLTTDTSLFSSTRYYESIGISGSYIYADGDKHSLTSPYALVASYPNVEGAVMVGGYFYEIDDGKIVKYAGTPGGGIAKSILGL